LEQTPDASAKRHRPTMTRRRCPVRGDHRTRDEVPTALHVVMDEGTECHLIDAIVFRPGPDVVGENAHDPGSVVCHGCGGGSSAYLIDPDLAVGRRGQVEPRAHPPDDLAGACG